MVRLCKFPTWCSWFALSVIRSLSGSQQASHCLSGLPSTFLNLIKMKFIALNLQARYHYTGDSCVPRISPCLPWASWSSCLPQVGCHGYWPMNVTKLSPICLHSGACPGNIILLFSQFQLQTTNERRRRAEVQLSNISDGNCGGSLALGL